MPSPNGAERVNSRVPAPDGRCEPFFQLLVIAQRRLDRGHSLSRQGLVEEAVEFCVGNCHKLCFELQPRANSSLVKYAKRGVMLRRAVRSRLLLLMLRVTRETHLRSVAAASGTCAAVRGNQI